MTAGEVVEGNRLIESQVIKPSRMFADAKYKVEYIFIEPILKIVKNKILLKGKVGQTKDFQVSDSCNRFYSLLQSRKMLSYIFILFLAKRVASRIYKCMDLEGELVLVCRSYIANSVALQLKEFNPMIKVVFDTRGLLSIELPVTNGKSGVKRYGYFKNWEHYLISGSDAVIVVTRRSLEYLKLETGLKDKIFYVPISGINTEDAFKCKFSERWNLRKTAYIGSMGVWHEINIVKQLFDLLVSNAGFNCEIISGSRIEATGYKTVSYSFSQMRKVYESLLAVTVTGNSRKNDYFESAMSSINLFSTKAAEALSLGVPLIVNSSIIELADFVMNNKCGIIFEFSEKDQSIQLINCAVKDLNNRKFWEQMSMNALRAGKIFRQKNVFLAQKKIVDSLFQT